MVTSTDRHALPLLTAEDAAQLLAISRSRVYELLAAGVIASVKIGRSRRIEIGALERYVESLRNAPADEPG